MEDDITEAREEIYKAGEKRKGEESTEPARTTKKKENRENPVAKRDVEVGKMDRVAANHNQIP